MPEGAKRAFDSARAEVALAVGLELTLQEFFFCDPRRNRAGDMRTDGREGGGRYPSALGATESEGFVDRLGLGLTTAGKDTDLSVFKPDLDPTTQTDPLLDDTDQDGIKDGTEDLNRNGRVDSGEANPQLWDTDHDGLPDGWVNLRTAGQGAYTCGFVGRRRRPSTG